MHNSEEFYQENIDFVNDIMEYYPKIKEAFEFVIKEVSNNTIQIEQFYIALVPFKPGIRGIAINCMENRPTFECDDIRSDVGYILNSREILEFETKYKIEFNDKELNLKKCEIYGELKNSDMSIRRHGAIENKIAQEIIKKKLFSPSVLKKNNANIFVSNWIEYGVYSI